MLAIALNAKTSCNINYLLMVVFKEVIYCDQLNSIYNII